MPRRIGKPAPDRHRWSRAKLTIFAVSHLRLPADQVGELCEPFVKLGVRLPGLALDSGCAGLFPFAVAVDEHTPVAQSVSEDEWRAARVLERHGLHVSPDLLAEGGRKRGGAVKLLGREGDEQIDVAGRSILAAGRGAEQDRERHVVTGAQTR